MVNHDERLTELERNVKAIWAKCDKDKEVKDKEDDEFLVWKTKIDLIGSIIARLWWGIALATITGVVGIILNFIRGN